MLARYTPTNTMLMFTWDIIITPTIHMSCLHFPRTWSLANMSCYCCQFQTILCTLEIDDQCRGHRIKQKDHIAGSSPPSRDTTHPQGTSWGRACNLQPYQETLSENKEHGTNKQNKNHSRTKTLTETPPTKHQVSQEL